MAPPSSSACVPPNPCNQQRKERHILEYHEAAQAYRAASDDPERSQISDPRRNVDSASFTTYDMKEARRIPKELVTIGIVPTSKVEYDPRFGDAIRVHVNIWSRRDRAQLTEYRKQHPETASSPVYKHSGPVRERKS